MVRAAAAAALFLLLLAPALPLEAELASSVTFAAYGTVMRWEDAAAVSALLKTRLDLLSAGNPNVKGHLQLDGWLADGFTLDIPRAYIKVRLPWFRLTLGKTRLSWGQGFVFNAGDVIFGSLDLVAGDLSAEALRDQTAWLGSLYVPLGAFSFLETVVLPYGVAEPGVLGTDLAALLAPVPLGSLSGGARGLFTVAGVQVEAGYFADGRGGHQRPYLSLQGHLGADWQLSASESLPLKDPQREDWESGFALTGGLFHIASLGSDGNLNLRLEAAVRPWAVWREKEGAEAVPAGFPGAPVYGLYLFPEIGLALSETLSLQLRALISPVDGSALGLLGFGWNIYQGFTLSSYLSIMLGDADDLYAWARNAGISATLGAEFVY